jgi:hypothetical protein
MKRRRGTAAEADLMAMRLRRENMVASHKAVMEEYKVREMIKASEKIKNYQTQYGSLLAAHSRLPIGLQGPALQRMQDVGNVLTALQDRFPWNFPRGSMPNAGRYVEV